MPLILPGNVASATASTTYDVANSCRFNDDDSAYMRLTPGSSATDSKKMTISFWCKRGNVGITGRIFNAEAGYGRDSLFFNSDDNLWLYIDNGQEGNLKTTRVFRDCSAWYHIVLAIDTTQATDTNRVKIYINGVQETSFSSDGDGIVYPDQDYDITGFGQNGQEATIGADTDPGNSDNEWDGYLAEMVFIDGLQLAPTSFGEFDEDSPTIWKPIDVSGLTFGTNGTYLDFEDSADLGADVSGNSNDFTSTNLAATDQATDTPTNNFATLNPLWRSRYVNGGTFSEGNTSIAFTASDSDNGYGFSTLGASSGKWYWEIKVPVVARALIGVGDANIIAGFSSNFYEQNPSYGIGMYNDGALNANNTSASYADALSDNDIVMVALDMDNYLLWYGINGTWQNSATQVEIENGTATNDATTEFGTQNVINNGEPVFPFVWDLSSSGQASFQCNFGNPPYAISSGNADANGYGNMEYAIPSGYYTLCTKNLAEYG